MNTKGVQIAEETMKHLKYHQTCHPEKAALSEALIQLRDDRDDFAVGMREEAKKHKAVERQLNDRIVKLRNRIEELTEANLKFPELLDIQQARIKELESALREKDEEVARLRQGMQSSLDLLGLNPDDWGTP